MNVTIETNALRALLFGILSCQCPVEEPVERALFKEFRKQAGQADHDLAPFLAIAETNPVRTPVHLFLEFCRYGQDDPFCFAIGLSHVIRYFCSLFHYKAVTAGLDPVLVPNPAAHLVGHMLLPLFLTGEENGVAKIGPVDVELKNLFLPREIETREGDALAMHFGLILAPLDREQVKVANDHLALIPGFETLAARCGVIDYADYQAMGDHQAHIAERYQRNL